MRIRRIAVARIRWPCAIPMVSHNHNKQIKMITAISGIAGTAIEQNANHNTKPTDNAKTNTYTHMQPEHELRLVFVCAELRLTRFGGL